MLIKHRRLYVFRQDPQRQLQYPCPHLSPLVPLGCLWALCLAHQSCRSIDKDCLCTALKPRRPRSLGLSQESSRNRSTVRKRQQTRWRWLCKRVKVGPWFQTKRYKGTKDGSLRADPAPPQDAASFPTAASALGTRGTPTQELRGSTVGSKRKHQEWEGPESVLSPFLCHGVGDLSVPHLDWVPHTEGWGLLQRYARDSQQLIKLRWCWMNCSAPLYSLKDQMNEWMDRDRFGCISSPGPLPWGYQNEDVFEHAFESVH